MSDLSQTPTLDENGDLSRSLGHGLEAFRAHGLLYVLNEFWAHGEGLEIRVLANDEVVAVGYGEKNRRWLVADEVVDDARRRARQLKLDCQTYNNPGFWGGHSEGFGGKTA